ncbi:unnamed protein product [Cladocopium goreaui]|uniref:SMB domain-containing protein n=1 Tax=Cladocopium goreaui TaxID=2562237 RepID=A0A9P1C765_9DINO|nr:unnamed protein product [Cladocopium goreaui]
MVLLPWLLWMSLVPSRGTGGTGSCKEIGCGGHDETCWCVASCWSFNDCCEDFASVCPEKPPSVQLAEVNFLVTTDLHSWIEGRKHQPHLDASLAHVASVLEHLRHSARSAMRDVFFFDNGDINDGTGLSASAEDHVEYLAPVLRSAKYDALNVGNHELYQRNGYGMLPGAACPIVGLKESGYIDSWNGRYLTSNVVWAKSQQPVGERYAVIEGEFGTKLLVFGFLYNMRDHCDAVQVLDVQDVVNSTWFQDAVDGYAAHVDAVVVLAHMDYRDDLVDLLWRTLRSRVGETKPIQVFAGHSHIRGYRQLDNFSSVYEAGCKLDTVGFLSFQHRSDGCGLDFDHANITGNVHDMAGALHLDLLRPNLTVNRALEAAKVAAGTDRVLGCSPEHYYLSNALQEKNSLWSFYMEKVVPGTLFDSEDQLAILGTGALSYDIFPGTFTVDDVYMTSPYGNFWLILQKISGEILQQLISKLNDPADFAGLASPLRGRGESGFRVPSYVSSSVPKPGKTYDLIFCDFDLEPIVQHLKDLVKQQHFDPQLFKPAMNTSSVLEAWFQKQPCGEETYI